MPPIGIWFEVQYTAKVEGINGNLKNHSLGLGCALTSIGRFQVPFKEFQRKFIYLGIFEIAMPSTDDRIKRDGDAMRN